MAQFKRIKCVEFLLLKIKLFYSGVQRIKQCVMLDDMW